MTKTIAVRWAETLGGRAIHYVEADAWIVWVDNTPLQDSHACHMFALKGAL